MKYFIPMLLLLVSCSSKRSKKEIIALGTSLNDTSELRPFNKGQKQQSKAIKLDSNYCNTSVLVKTHNNINDLTVADISKFLSTFHKDCNTNVEFSEWSNELLYQIFDTYTKEVTSLIAKENNYEKEAILSALKSPINDTIMPQSLIEKIQKFDSNNQVTKEIVIALQIAANKY